MVLPQLAVWSPQRPVSICASSGPATSTPIKSRGCPRLASCTCANTASADGVSPPAGSNRWAGLRPLLRTVFSAIRDELDSAA
ncbi:MAG: hypothetical protein ACLP0J_16570 [Solirubrobacteraceae bacterium]